LKLFAKWIEQTAESEDEFTKNNLLKELINLFDKITTDIPNIQNDIVSSTPSCFLLKTAFAIKQIKINEEELLLKTTTCKALGNMLAHSVLKERSELKKRILSLEKPESIEEYYEAMPLPLINFFTGLISTIKEKNLQVLARKRKERNMPSLLLDIKKI
jgi:hypothetical protein